MVKRTPRPLTIDLVNATHEEALEICHALLDIAAWSLDPRLTHNDCLLVDALTVLRPYTCAFDTPDMPVITVPPSDDNQQLEIFARDTPIDPAQFGFDDPTPATSIHQLVVWMGRAALDDVLLLLYEHLHPRDHEQWLANIESIPKALRSRYPRRRWETLLPEWLWNLDTFALHQALICEAAATRRTLVLVGSPATCEATPPRSRPMSKAELAKRILGNANARARQIDWQRFDLQSFDDTGRRWTVPLATVTPDARERLESPHWP